LALPPFTGSLDEARRGRSYPGGFKFRKRGDLEPTIMNVGHLERRWAMGTSSDWAFKDGKEVTIGPATFYNLFTYKLGGIFGTGAKRKYDIISCTPNGAGLKEIFSLVANGRMDSTCD
jgi:hypothetical protein